MGQSARRWVQNLGCEQENRPRAWIPCRDRGQNPFRVLPWTIARDHLWQKLWTYTQSKTWAKLVNQKVKTSSNSEGHNTMLPAGTKKGAHLSSTCYLTFPHPKRTTQPLIWARLSRPRPAPSSCSPLGQPLHRLASPIPLTSPKRAAGGEIATPLPPRYPHCSNPHHNKRVLFLK